MNLNLKKDELRAIYKGKRMALSEKEVDFLSKKIFEQFILQFNIVENQKVNVFLPIKKFNEVDTWLFVNYFFQNNNRVFVPKVQGNEMISVEIFPDSQYEVNKWSITEPVSNSAEYIDFDIVLTPMLYCDRCGNRIGYGKGFYDRFFLDNLGIRKKIGLNFFNPHEEIINVFGSDVTLDGLITADSYYSF